MEKQTAVEWLVENIDDLIPFIDVETSEKFSKLIVKAKEMEKVQTLLFAEGYDEYVFRGGSATAEQYYNETFL